VRTIAIVNQKGGCGKTTTAINLAGLFASLGVRTLLVDLDPQSHCAAGLSIPEHRIDLDVTDLLTSGDRTIDWSRLIWSPGAHLDLIPSRTRLAGVEALAGGLAEGDGRERRLASALLHVAPRYDACLIDCPPSIGLLTFNALAAADTVLIPVETGYFALQGATRQLGTVRSMARRMGRSIQAFVVPTMHDEASELSRDLLTELRRRFGSKVLPVAIRADASLREAASVGRAVVEHAPDSRGTQDYLSLAEHLMEALDLVPSRSARAGIEQLAVARTSPEAREKAIDAAEHEPLVIEVVSHEALVASAEARATPGAGSEVRMSLDRAADLARRARMLSAHAKEPGSGSHSGDGLHALVAGGVTRESLVESKHAAGVEIGGPTEFAADHANASERSRAIEPVRFGVTARAGGVRLAQPLSVGGGVAVAGEFNGWSASSHTMRRDEALGAWVIELDLPPGKHAYRLVIDGQWVADAFNPLVQSNPFGESNSIIDVPAGS
jgi:chromosome partitioning protein